MAQQQAGRRPLPSQERRPPPAAGTEAPAAADWVTLREAHSHTGIPVSTLRSWSKKGRVSSQLDLTDAGPRRMVILREVVDRARALGRLDEEPVGVETRSVVPDEPAPEPESPPDGAMLVPIDAWNRMLNQLGNLHQAGQQLAEARERAARAETEAAFLRERMAELRSEVRRLEDQPSQDVEPPPPAVEPEAARPKRLRVPFSRLWLRRRR